MLTFWQDTVHPRGDIGLFFCCFFFNLNYLFICFFCLVHRYIRNSNPGIIYISPDPTFSARGGLQISICNFQFCASVRTWVVYRLRLRAAGLHTYQKLKKKQTKKQQYNDKLFSEFLKKNKDKCVQEQRPKRFVFTRRRRKTKNNNFRYFVTCLD